MIMIIIMMIKVMGVQLPVFTKYDNPAAASPSPTRQLTHNYLLSVNWALLLAPVSLASDWLRVIT